MTWRNIPELRFIRGFHKLDAYIDALADRVTKSFSENGRPDKRGMSFHGVPEKTLHDGDPYHCECHVTARLLAQKLKLGDNDWEISFQSRFGKAKWIGPATDAVLKKLGKANTGRVDVICPGFVSDCLETLEEINMEGRETFTESGGRQFHYIPCLNDSPKFIAALAQVIAKNAGGWPAKRLVENNDQAAAKTELTDRAKRAKTLGAKT